MHVFLYIRGIYQQTELMKAMLQSQFWTWKRVKIKGKKREEVTQLVQGSLRPTIWGAYEYIIPKESLSEFLAIIGCTSNGLGAEDTFKNRARMAMLRKFFGAKAIPKEAFKASKGIKTDVFINGFQRGLSNLFVGGVAMHVIGIKEDDYREQDFGNAGVWEQEML